MHDCPIPYTEAQSPNMCSWTHNRYDMPSVTMHDCLLLFIICANLSTYTQPHSPTTFKLQHIHYTHTSHQNAYRRRVKMYSSISRRPRKGKMDIQYLKTDKVTHGSTECQNNEWTDISRWTQPYGFCPIRTMDYGLLGVLKKICKVFLLMNNILVNYLPM